MGNTRPDMEVFYNGQWVEVKKTWVGTDKFTWGEIDTPNGSRAITLSEYKTRRTDLDPTSYRDYEVFVDGDWRRVKSTWINPQGVHIVSIHNGTHSGDMRKLTHMKYPVRRRTGNGNATVGYDGYEVFDQGAWHSVIEVHELLEGHEILTLANGVEIDTRYHHIPSIYVKQRKQDTDKPKITLETFKAEKEKLESLLAKLNTAGKIVQDAEKEYSDTVYPMLAHMLWREYQRTKEEVFNEGD